MLKENQKKIAPVELGEEQVQSVLNEWERPARRRSQWATWRTVGVAGATAFSLLVLVVALPFLLSRDGSEATPSEEASGPSSEETRLASESGRTIIQLSVVTTPREAIVYLNGDSVGVTPLLGYTASPGDWAVSVRKSNYVAFDTVLTLEEDEGFYVPLEMAERGADDHSALPEPVMLAQRTAPAEREAPVRRDDAPERNTAPAAEETETAEASPPEGAGVSVTSQPSGATFWLDGERIGVTPLTVRNVLGKESRVRFQKDGYALYEAEIVLDETLHRELTLLEHQAVAEATPEQPPRDEARPTRERTRRSASETPAETRRTEARRTEPPAERRRAEVSAAPRRNVVTPVEPPAEGLREQSRTMLKRPEAGIAISDQDNSIIRVEGNRVLEAGKVENFRIVTKPGRIQPRDFYWESEAGVFARGRSIDVQFVDPGRYHITVMAVNDYFVDRASFELLVTSPPVAEESEPAEPLVTTTTRRSPPARTASQPERSRAEPPAEATATLERNMLYSTQSVALAQGGYAWVVASHLDRQSAIADMIRYRMAGYRSGVFEDSKETAGSTAYRVLIGQFPTEEVAMQVGKQLPNDVPGGVWLLDMTATPN